MKFDTSDLPLLEYDPSPEAVIMPDHEKLGYVFPPKAVYAFLGDEIDAYAHEQGAEVIGEFVSMTKKYPVYRLSYRGEEVCLCQAPVGASAAVQLLDWLVGYGVREIMTAGSCGVLVDLPENEFLIPTEALRDEGTSYHYLPPSRTVTLNPAMVGKIERVLAREGLSYRKGMTWTTDGFYRETEARIARRKAEGCISVEMECAALAACAEFRRVRFGQLLYTADTLADVTSYDERAWGNASVKKALQLCLEMITE